MRATKPTFIIVSLCLLLLKPTSANCQEKTIKVGPSRIWIMAISPNSEVVAINDNNPEGGKRLIIFDIKKEKTILSFTDGIFLYFGLSFSKDGKFLLTSRVKGMPNGERCSEVICRDIQTGEITKTRELVGTPIHFTNRVLVTALSKDKPGVAVVHDLDNGKELVIEGRGGHSLAAASSSDGKYVAISEADNGTTVWEVSSGKKLIAVPTKFGFSAGRFFPDKPVFAVGYKGGSYYELPSGKLLEITEKSGGSPSPDGKMSYNVGKLGILFPDKLRNGWSVKEYPDGLHIRSGYDGDVIASYPYQRGWLRHVQFSPDSKLLIAGGNDGALRIWDLSKLKP